MADHGVRSRPDVPRSAGAHPVEASSLRRNIARLFDPPKGPPKVGVEVEVLPVEVGSRRPVPPHAEGGRAIGPVLARWAKARGWAPRSISTGAPAFVDACGATVSFEPGGQIEYASPALTSLDALERDLVEVMTSLANALEAEGITLLARGVDPVNRLEDAELWVAGERYRRMAAHYARRGPWGRRMMRQTAAVHVNIDAVGPRFEAWDVVNAAVPGLVAAFANSPMVEGAPSGHRSARAAQWRRLDPTRTGVVGADGHDPVDAYLGFALDAEAFLLGPEAAIARPFRSHLGRASTDDWQRHLSTLFPEVRPRGYLEVRCIDALPLDLCLLPAALLIGLVFDAGSRAEARRRLAPPSSDLLIRAGRRGLANPEVSAQVETMFEVALQGLEALPDPLVGGGWRVRLEHFRERFTTRGLDPGCRTDDRFAAPSSGRPPQHLRGAGRAGPGDSSDPASATPPRRGPSLDPRRA